MRLVQVKEGAPCIHKHEDSDGGSSDLAGWSLSRWTLDTGTALASFVLRGFCRQLYGGRPTLDFMATQRLPPRHPPRHRPQITFCENRNTLGDVNKGRKGK